MFEFIAQIFRNMFVFVGMVTTKSSFPPALTPEEEQALLKNLQRAMMTHVTSSLNIIFDSLHILQKSTRHAAVMRMILSPSGLSDS